MAKKKVINQKQKQKQKQKQTVIVNINTKKSSRTSSKTPRAAPVSAPVSAPVPTTYQYLPRTVYYGDAATTSVPTSVPVSSGVKLGGSERPILRPPPRLSFSEPYSIQIPSTQTANQAIRAPPILSVSEPYSIQIPSKEKIQSSTSTQTANPAIKAPPILSVSEPVSIQIPPKPIPGKPALSVSKPISINFPPDEIEVYEESARLEMPRIILDIPPQPESESEAMTPIRLIPPEPVQTNKFEPTPKLLNEFIRIEKLQNYTKDEAERKFLEDREEWRMGLGRQGRVAEIQLNSKTNSKFMEAIRGRTQSKI
jgi:hypothetical protein